MYYDQHERLYMFHICHVSCVNCKKLASAWETDSELHQRCLHGTMGNRQVVCDVLNALGAGFSLKFIDLFLKACAVLAESR